MALLDLENIVLTKENIENRRKQQKLEISDITDIYIDKNVDIPAYAFQGYTSLQYIRNNSYIISIGDYAFDGCTSLMTRWFNNLQSIGKYAFKNCSSIQSFTFNDNLEFNEGCFQDCKKLISISLKIGAEIKKNLFKGCTALQSIANINQCTKIGESAFEDCTSIDYLTIKPGIIIGDYAFKGCTSLVRLAGSNGCISIGDYAFENCINLNYKWYNNATYIGKNAFIGTNYFEPENGSPISILGLKDTVKKHIISSSPNQYIIKYWDESYPVDPHPGNMLTIALNTFNQGDISSLLSDMSLTKESVKNIEFTGSNVIIGENSFNSFIALTGLYNFDKVISIKANAFRDCSALTEVSASELTALGSNAFAGCTSLSSLDLPKCSYTEDGALNAIGTPDETGHYVYNLKTVYTV